MTVNLSALAGAGEQFFDNNGVPLSGGKLYSYEAGTTTPQITYTTALGNVAHTNPIILNSAGRVAAGQIWLTAGENYKFVLYTANDVLIASWDNITGINGTGIATTASNVSYIPAGDFTETNVQDALDELTTSVGASIVGYLSAGTGAVATDVQTKLRESVSVKDFGAVGDGVTNNITFFQNAINYLLSIGGGELYIPAGVYWFPQGKKLDPGAGNILFRGDGMDASVLHYNEGTTVPATNGDDHLFLNVANTSKKHLQFENLQFRGTLDEGSRAGRWANPLWLDYYPTVTIQNCKFLNIAAEAMDFHRCGYFKCVDNYFKNIAADGIRARDTSNCFISGNYLEQLGDDAIALHTVNGYFPTRQGLIITNNRIVNGGAIKCLGGRVVHITNNQLEMLNFWAIEVQTESTGPEGQNGIRDILISNNTILDQLSISLIDGGTPQTTYVGIQVLGVTPRGSTATNNVIPGDYDSVTGDFILPQNYDEIDYSVADTPVPYTSGCVITGNILRRTRPAVAKYSDYGYGKRLFQGVAYDPAISDAALKGNVGITTNINRNVVVTNNIIESNYLRGFAFSGNANRRLVNMRVADNILYDVSNYGMTFSAVVNGQNIVIQNNIIECDPYRVNANSNNDGTYLVNGLPRGIDFENGEGFKVINNVFRNCCEAIQFNSFLDNILLNNILCCAPAVVGFSTSNKGIGDVVSPSGAYIYEIIDADPTSANYGQIQNAQITQSADAITAGTYVRGAYVRFTNPTLDVNNMVLLGWLRLTTGSSHVLGTDWARVYASHVSPAT